MKSFLARFRRALNFHDLYRAFGVRQLLLNRRQLNLQLFEPFLSLLPSCRIRYWRQKLVPDIVQLELRRRITVLKLNDSDSELRKLFGVSLRRVFDSLRRWRSDGGPGGVGLLGCRGSCLVWLFSGKNNLRL